MNLPDDFIHQATRYILGRMTGAVSTHCDWLVANWGEIPESQRMSIQNDVENAFTRDLHDPIGHHLGMACDKAYWARVRQLWRK